MADVEFSDTTEDLEDLISETEGYEIEYLN